MRLLVAVVACGAMGEALAAPPVLDRIEVVGNQATAVRLHLSAPASVAGRALPPSGGVPPRVYVDLADTTIAPALARVVQGAGPVLRVRAGQFDRATTRVVLDLAAERPFTVHQSNGTITIELGGPATTAKPAEAKPPPAPVAAAPHPEESARAVPLEPRADATRPAGVVAPPPASPTTERAAAPLPERPAPAPDAKASVPPKDGVAPPAAAVPPARIESAPVPAAPTEPTAHRAPPPSEPPAPPPPGAEPPAFAPVMPRGPLQMPSMGALPGALIALQNGRELPEHEARPAPPPAPEHLPEPPRHEAPAALATAAPPPAAPAEHAVASVVGPPPPPAAESTRLARATPARAENPAASREAAPPPPEGVRPPATKPGRRAPVAGQAHPLVVLDAGHGGRDPGAEGVGGILEKDVVLEVTRLVARRLAARLPVDVIMTRSDDSFIPIERRLALPGEGATLFISLHANACTDPSARGLEVFYGGGTVRTASTQGASRPAALLGRYINEALEARIGGVRGVARPGGFGVLVRNPVPSVLIEIGYLTHPGEAARAQDSAFHELLADAVVEGVASFLRASAPRL
jgi:N-acetylmuramoyl-L-alanine amidase